MNEPQVFYSTIDHTHADLHVGVCSECGALVGWDDQTTHTAWHRRLGVWQVSSDG